MAYMKEIGLLLTIITVTSSATLKYSHHSSNDLNYEEGIHKHPSKGGGYDIYLSGEVWLRTTPIFITVENKHYSTADDSLKLLKVKFESGSDNLGLWNSTSMIYKTIDLNVTMKFYIKEYPGISALIFGQHFYDAVSGASVGDRDMVSTGFPSFYVEDAIHSNRSYELGFLAYGGIMVGDTNKAIGIWNPDDAKKIKSGLDSGPLVLFSETGDAVVISSFTSMMTGSVQYHGKDDQMTATWGQMGELNIIPKDFTYEVIAYYSSKGINKAMEGWGETLKTYYNKNTDFRNSDFANNYIGYWTDNGAYYYYLTEKEKNYEETILDLKSYADKLGIPYRYIQFDSWFYPKGKKDGVTEWTALKSVFPHGLKYLWEKTGWPVVAHNRWWSDKTVYAKINGGKYNFVIEEQNNKAIPIDQGFWDDLLTESKEWGLITYEQDWLNVEFDEMDITVRNVSVGREWLNQMGRGAQGAGITVQYCMAPSRHALHSLTIPAVTQVRVSIDYLLRSDQWKIGITSMFADAVGSAPFKDNFWTTSHQPGNPYNKSEPAPALQSLVATLSTGPVGPSDKIGFSNVDLIMRTCNKDGLILKPSRPATAVNKQLIQAAFGGFTGEAWSTYSSISHFMFGIILGADIKDQSITLGPTDAGFSSQMADTFIFNRDSPKVVTLFTDKNPLTLISCPVEKPCIYYSTPVFNTSGTSVIILGELNKWVPMSPQRVTSLTLTPKDIHVTMAGAVGESVTISYLVDHQMAQMTCLMSEAGTAIVHLLRRVCRDVS